MHESVLCLTFRTPMYLFRYCQSINLGGFIPDKSRRLIYQINYTPKRLHFYVLHYLRLKIFSQPRMSLDYVK